LFFKVENNSRVSWYVVNGTGAFSDVLDRISTQLGDVQEIVQYSDHHKKYKELANFLK